MKLNVNKNIRYLPKSIGVEVESDKPMMEELEYKLSELFPSGNSESDTIYECQTVPVQTSSILDVALLGEVVRRCIPNYVVGGYDNASASAHCHIVGLNTDLEEEHIEALMVGLMPFLSLGWLKPELEKYTFRSSVSGSSPCGAYARLVTSDIDTEVSGYSGRYTWLKDQTDRHGSPSGEIRANENSPLWVYFINPILTNQDMIDRLRAMSRTKGYISMAKTIRYKNGHYEIFHDFIEEVKKVVVPFLMDSIENILPGIQKNQQEFGNELLTAYLEENIVKYDALISGIIDSDEEITSTFNIIDEQYENNKTKFNVIKEKK